MGGKRYCTNCGVVAYPKTVTPGSIGIELLLWLFFIIPGLIYSIWRLAAQHKACPSCGARNMISLNSPVAMQHISSQGSSNIAALDNELRAGDGKESDAWRS